MRLRFFIASHLLYLWSLHGAITTMKLNPKYQPISCGNKTQLQSEKNALCEWALIIIIHYFLSSVHLSRIKLQTLSARSHCVICDCDLFLLIMSWWCHCSRIEWTLPLSPVQPCTVEAICYNKRNRSRNQKKNAQCEWALNKRALYQIISHHVLCYNCVFP